MRTGINRGYREGPVARGIEDQTAKMPSDVFLWASFGSMGIALVFQLMGWKDKSLFVGQWAAPLLVMGLYNKLVKVQGHD